MTRAVTEWTLGCRQSEQLEYVYSILTASLTSAQWRTALYRGGEMNACDTTATKVKVVFLGSGEVSGTGNFLFRSKWFPFSL